MSGEPSEKSHQSHILAGAWGNRCKSLVEASLSRDVVLRLTNTAKVPLGRGSQLATLRR